MPKSFLLLILLLMGFSWSVRAQTSGSLPRDYDRFYPYYFKYCSTSKYHPHKAKGLEGGIAGHGLFYLKGVCSDKSLGPSGLKLCDKQADFSDPELGVGISTDKGLKNVNFFVIPNKRLFFFGDSDASVTFKNDEKDLIIEKVLADKIFSGIEFQDSMYPPGLLAEHKEEFIARYVFGTDYGLAVARHLYCINIPMTRSLMGLIVTFLNDLNASYSKGQGETYRGVFSPSEKTDKSYHWHGLFDNCTHTPINALALLGVVKPKKINQTLFTQLHHIAMPANTLLDIHESVHAEDIDVKVYFKDPIKRKIFEEHAWIAQGEGSVVEVMKAQQNNLIYQADENMLYLPHIFKNRGKILKQMQEDDKYSFRGIDAKGLLSNFMLFDKKYHRALDIIKQRKQELADKKENKEYSNFIERFKSYIETKIIILEHRMSILLE